MKQFLLQVLALVRLGKALNPIEVQSQDFVDTGTGKRFEIIGVDYQPGGQAGYNPASGEDPLSNGDTCLRDAALMQQLGLNAIRVYSVDPYISHDECASIFNSVGIYMILDVNSPLHNESIDRTNPGPSYTAAYLNRTFAVIEAFRNYPNVIGFFSGNEIINDPTTAMQDPRYIRAVTRDLKQYITARGGRGLYIGYSAADVRNVLVDTSNYLQCTIQGEGDASSRSDFFALNSYSWCGPYDNFETSTYDQLAQDFASTTIPVFFSEYGCVVPKPRVFNEVTALYGPQMTTWSGGLVYQWTEEGAGYGLVQVNQDGSVSLTVDFDNLQIKYSQLDFSLIQSQNATAQSLVAPECSSSLVDGSQFENSFNIPAAPSGAEQMISQGVYAATGSIISVTKTAVNVVVTAVGGSTKSGLAITHVTSAYRPTTAAAAVITSTAAADGSAAATAAGSGSSSASSPTNKGTGNAMHWPITVLLTWVLSFASVSTLVRLPI